MLETLALAMLSVPISAIILVILTIIFLKKDIDNL